MSSPYQINRATQIVDVRPWSERTAEALADPLNLLMVAGCTIFLTFLIPMLMPLTIPALLTMFIASSKVGGLLPQRYPPGQKTPEGKSADGILFLGNMEYAQKKEDRLPLESPADKFKEVWFADDDMRKHLLVLGSTGSGKSELLKGIFFNALCWGSGFFVADGKADNKLPLDTFNLARFFGRDDDYLVLNFLLAGKTPEQVRKSRRRRTNKTNPFSTSDSDTIIQMGANLLPKVDGDAKNWQEKALNLWRGEVPALCWMRDHEGMQISVKTFVDYLALPKVEELYAKGYSLAKIAEDGSRIWPEAFEGIRSYCEVGLPGFKIDRCLKKFKLADSRPGPGGKPDAVEQDSNTYDQHGYRSTQLNPALNLLDKTYGHIFADKFSEVDMVDVTLNNRILCLLIPSLERSAQEAESLGKLTVAVLRVMMGKNLGADIEGNRVQILESKATEARYPYIVALDELGYYFADGIAVMFAQARSLGFSMIAAAQDIEKLTEGSRAAEAGAMLANQVMKIFMRIDDANKTNEMIQKYLDKVSVALRKSYEHQSGFGFKRLLEVSVEEIPIATLSNLQRLGAGTAILNAMGQTFKVKSFYVGGFLQKHPREQFHINRFLQVRAFTKDEISAMSLPVDVLNDPYVKGQKLKNLLSGDQAWENLRSGVLQSSYQTKHAQAVAMLQAIAGEAKNFPPGIDGAQRAAALFNAARQHLVRTGATAAPSGRVSGSQKDVHKQAEPTEKAAVVAGAPEIVRMPAVEPFVTVEQAFEAISGAQTQAVQAGAATPSGEAISHGSGTGEGASGADAFADDPFSFLNTDKPLERKPATQVIKAQSVEVIGEAALAIDRMAGNNAITANLEMVLSGSQSSGLDQAVPDYLQPVLRGMDDRAFELDFSALEGQIPKVEAEVGSGKVNGLVGPQDASVRWIGKALSRAHESLSTKGDTLVGFTKRTQESFANLESALGNPNPEKVTQAIEQLVANQTTPAVVEPTSSGNEMLDIDDLLKEIQGTSR